MQDVSAHYEHRAPEAERLASDLIELSTRFPFSFAAIGKFFRGWARSASVAQLKASHGSTME